MFIRIVLHWMPTNVGRNHHGTGYAFITKQYNHIRYHNQLNCIRCFSNTGITSIGGMFCGFLSNHIDIAPSYAGTLMALTNTAATIPGIIVPLFVAHMTHGNVSVQSTQSDRNSLNNFVNRLNFSKRLVLGVSYSL